MCVKEVEFHSASAVIWRPSGRLLSPFVSTLLTAAVASKFALLAKRRPVASSRWLPLFQSWRPLAGLDRLNAGEPLVNVMMLGGMVVAATSFSLSTLIALLSVPEIYQPWLLRGLPLVAALVALRSLLLALRWGPVTLDQMKHLQEWMLQSPDLSHAVSHWIRPGQRFYQGDYLAIRNAAAFELRYAHGRALGQASSPLPQWFIAFMNRRFHRAQVAASSSQKINPQKAWSVAQADNQMWVQSQVAQGVGNPAWPVGLSSEERKRLQALETAWASRRVPLVAQPSAPQVQVWAGWVRHRTSAFRRCWEGVTWSQAWLRPAGWAFLRGWVVSGVVLFIASKLASIQRTALALPPSEAAGSWVGQWALLFLESMRPLSPHLWVIALIVGGMSALHAALSGLRLMHLRKAWWSLPLSAVGRQRLEELLFEAPAVRGPFLSRLGVNLTQADLAFARGASQVLARHHRQAQEEADRERNTTAMEGLPAMAAYRARMLEAKLPLVETPSVRPRL